MRISGLSLVMGSWKIKPSSGPRNERKSRFRMVTRSRSRNLTSPVTFAASGNRPSTPLPRVDLPLPDSPTRPNVSPRRRSNETPSTARTAPRAVPYQTLRSRTESTGSDECVCGSGPSIRDTVGHLALDVVDDVDGEQLPAAEHRVEQVVEALPHQGEA